MRVIDESWVPARAVHPLEILLAQWGAKACTCAPYQVERLDECAQQVSSLAHSGEANLERIPIVHTERAEPAPAYIAMPAVARGQRPAHYTPT